MTTYSGTRNPAYKHGGKVGKRPSRTYSIYRAMLDRCGQPANPNWKWYGALGVKVCDRWRGERGFINFLEDMGEVPLGMSIDRWPNKNGNYEPGNCRWATQKEQQRNRRNNRHVTFKGETLTLAEWDERMGFGVSRRLRDGWSIEDAFTVPRRSKEVWLPRKQMTMKATSDAKHLRIPDAKE